MISPRFSAADLTSTADASSVSPVPSEIHIHLHVPEQVTVGLMQFLATLTQQRTLFDPQTTYTNVARVSDAGSSSPVSSQAPTPKQFESSPPPSTTAPVNVPAESPSQPETMHSLLLNAPMALRRKRAKASKDQQSQHVTSCKTFDRWVAQCDRSTGPVKSLLDWIRSDGEQLDACISRDFALWCLTTPSKKTGQPLSTTRAQHLLTHVGMVCRAYGVPFVRLDKAQLDLLLIKHQGIDSESTLITEERRCPTLDEIHACLNHCDAATAPYGTDAVYFHRGAIAFFAFFGLRSNDFISTDPTKTGLRKQDIFWQEACPVDKINDAHGSVIINPGGIWLVLRIHKTEGKNETSLVLPVPAFLVPWLKYFHDKSEHPVMVFPATVKGRNRLSIGSLMDSFDRIIAAAGLTVKIRWSEGSGGVLALRKFPLNRWRMLVQEHMKDMALARMVARYMGHHSSGKKSTSEQFYVDDRATLLPVIIQLMPHFPHLCDLTPPE